MPEAPPEPALYAGFGCRQGCPVEVLEQLLASTLAAHGLSLSSLRGLASLARKRHEPGLLALAERLGLSLQTFSGAELAPFERHLRQRSAIAFAHTGCWGVAESAALASAQQAEGRCALRVSRQTLGAATLAVAWRG